MMPTFPRSSLSFRTAGFPQYGWKAGLPDGAFLYVAQLKPAPGIRWSSLRARLRTAMRRSAPPTPGALALVRVVEAPMARFEEVADGRAKGACQDESSPEQCCQHGESRKEHNSASIVS
jgi:hypothetical protein